MTIISMQNYNFVCLNYYFSLKRMKNIILIGSGNVNYHLGHALYYAGYNIVQIISRNEKNARNLSCKLNADFETEIDKIKHADLVIIGVNDDSIDNISKKITNIPFAHTSGTVCLPSGGVLYPVQTFNKEVSIDFSEVPLCISSNDDKLKSSLYKLANSISNKVYLIKQNQRKILHLAAVFACNFSNNMYCIAEDILKESDLDFEILKPLIIETANKINKYSPNSVQTGPAARKDYGTIESHIKLLDDENLRILYNLITRQITKRNE